MGRNNTIWTHTKSDAKRFNTKEEAEIAAQDAPEVTELQKALADTVKPIQEVIKAIETQVPSKRRGRPKKVA